MLVMLAGLVIVSMLVVPTASARYILPDDVVYRAWGTLDEYNPDYGWSGNCRIIGGVRRLRISVDGAVAFTYCYLEENIQEEIPGTIDTWIIILKEVITPPLTIIEDECEFVGLVVVYKFGWDTATGKRKVWTWEEPNRIKTTASGIWINWSEGPFPLDWEVRGSTRFIHY
jgi:hypothetical protein